MAAMQKSSGEATTSPKYRGDEVRIFYASRVLVILENPLNSNRPMVVLKQKIHSFWDRRKEVESALDLCGMELTGEPSLDENGLWHCPVQVRGG